MTRAIGRALLLAGALGLAGCDEDLRDIAGPSPDLEPTLSSIQREIFSTTDRSGRLACVQCHTDVGRVPAAGLVLLEGRSWAALVNRPSSQKSGETLVVPGDAANSYLVAKLEGRPGIVGQRMPRTAGPFLTDGQILIIRRWIERGAPND